MMRLYGNIEKIAIDRASLISFLLETLLCFLLDVSNLSGDHHDAEVSTVCLRDGGHVSGYAIHDA